MAILVWLTQTKTGDLDELHLTNLNHLLFSEIAHRGTSFLAKNQPFYAQDFVRFFFRERSAKQFFDCKSCLFLVQETQRKRPLLPESPYLLIDEAHHLPDIAEKVNDRRLSIVYFFKQIQQFNESDHLFDRIKAYLPENHEVQRWLEIYQEELNALNEAQIFLAEGLNQFAAKQTNGQYPEEMIVTL